MSQHSSPLYHLPVIRHIHTRPRLFIAIGLGMLLYFLLPSHWANVTRILVGWDTVTGSYTLLVAGMMLCSNMANIRRRAAQEDEGKLMALIMTSGAAIASLFAIFAELASVKSGGGGVGLSDQLRIGLAALTVLLSWMFIHTIFALHYAHSYYEDVKGNPRGGLEFPGTKSPDYWDFVYYSFIIGTACATADVDITSPGLRKISTLHCILAFFFNTTILALTINIAASLF